MHVAPSADTTSLLITGCVALGGTIIGVLGALAATAMQNRHASKEREATTRRIYAGHWRDAEERNAIVLRQLAEAGIGQ